MKPGPCAREIIFAPEHLAVGRIKAGKRPTNPKRDHFPISHRRGAAWSAVLSSVWASDLFDGILVLPKFFAVLRVQAKGDFIRVLACRNIQTILHERWSRVARTDRHLPFLYQF